ncbi:MAG TPA: ribonuclease III [Hyphomicrobiaceae bacterium]|nr:ribonuclease III [Hyphomicrobiaceae bacterium]
MTHRSKGHARLEARLGYRFADPGLLDRALTHSSAIAPSRRVTESYQRLEFLGDRVLDLVVADMLYRRYPNAPEGDLNRTLVTLVRAETNAEIARELDLGAELNLGEDARRTGGADNDTILGDAAEALIGALYLDGGLGAAYEFLERQLGDKLDIALHKRPDAKTMLQEWAQARGLEPPDYEVISQVGPHHAPEFTIAVKLANFDPLTATGPSKKLAEHKAAEAFLVREKVWQGGGP